MTAAQIADGAWSVPHAPADVPNAVLLAGEDRS
jgi:hypothetical protein